MGSYKPYIQDTLTGVIKYISDTVNPPPIPQAEKDLAYFQRNFSRIYGGPTNSMPKPHKRGYSNRGEDAAYYSLYYLGHRIDKIDY
ncbi:MAG: hypothetical protein WCJ64_10570 [Rhodospirillaceae bacterium]